MASVAQNIYYYRLEMGLTQKELARRSGVPQPNLSRIEKGRDFQISTLREIAAALGLEAADLLRGADPAAVDKQKLFSRPTIEKVTENIAGKSWKLSNPQLVELVDFLKPLFDTNLRGRSKKSIYRQWIRLRRTFTPDEIDAIRSRVEKARQRLG